MGAGEWKELGRLGKAREIVLGSSGEIPALVRIHLLTYRVTPSGGEVVSKVHVLDSSQCALGKVLRGSTGPWMSSSISDQSSEVR